MWLPIYRAQTGHSPCSFTSSSAASCSSISLSESLFKMAHALNMQIAHQSLVNEVSAREEGDPYGSKAAFLMINWHLNSVKWCEHNTNSPVLCSSVADTSWDEVNCMMYRVCPDIALGLCSQLARTQSSAQLIPARSVWFDVPNSWRIGFMKNRCVLTTPQNSASWRSCSS